MQLKRLEFSKLWHDDKWIEDHIPNVEEVDYSQIDYLEVFNDTHPSVMQNRIKLRNWNYVHNFRSNKLSIKNYFKYLMYKWFSWEIGYKNYKEI
jgi:hypothetical protein